MDSASVVPGDHIVIHVGNVIPFDGVVADGEAMINQASMTGESEPVRKEKGGFVYAGTVVEEGELTIEVKAVSGSTRYEKIVTMIEDSEKLKVRSRGACGASGGQAGSLHLPWNRSYMAAYKKCYQNVIRTDG